MKFFKKYWYLVILALLTAGVGTVAYLTTTKLREQAPVAPNVPQGEPQAIAPACVLSFTLNVTPTPTPTPGLNKEPVCDELTVNPLSGNFPLMVTLICTGTDADGDITDAEFNFGEGTPETKAVDFAGSHKSVSTTHTYNQAGSFTASCRVKDNNQAFSPAKDSCKKTISPTGEQPTPTPEEETTPYPTPTPAEEILPTPTAIPTPKVPVAGSPSVLGATAIGLGTILLLLGLAL